MEKIEVLIVEDDPMMAFLHGELVKKHQIASEPIGFRNGSEALEFLLKQEDITTKYLVLLDLNMPVMNGWEFLNELKTHKISCRTEVVIITSSTDRADRNKAARYEMVTHYLSKPVMDFTPIQQAKDLLKKKSVIPVNNDGA